MPQSTSALRLLEDDGTIFQHLSGPWVKTVQDRGSCGVQAARLRNVVYGLDEIKVFNLIPGGTPTNQKVEFNIDWRWSAYENL